MTFYNVISAVIFVGAFRELLSALQAGNRPVLWMASLLALLVFNDAIFTSWTVETRQQRYSPQLMAIDLMNFMTLSLALVFLNPTQTNVLQLELKQLATSWLSEVRFWMLLGGYWLLVMLWTKLARVYANPKYPRWLIPWAFGVSGLFLLQALLVAIVGPASQSSLAHFVSGMAFAYAAIYILLIRAAALRAGLD